MPLALSYTVQIVLLGSILLGIVGGVLGCFALLRRQSLLGDALAHAALPGVCLAFLIQGSKDSLGLLLGALFAGVTGALFILLVVRGSRIKEDSAIGIVLSVFFGIGIVLLTFIQKKGTGNQSGLDQFLFGQAATILANDVILFSSVGAVVLAVLLLTHKELKLLCFDREFGASLGFPMTAFEILMTCLLVVVVVIGLQTVGVVLMVAALITPAAAARQWTDRFGRMLTLAGAIGGLSSGLGVFASATIERLPTGPAIVVVSSGILVFSILMAPARGLLWAFWRQRKFGERIRRENLLKDLWSWGEQHGEGDSWATLPAIMGIRGQSGREVWRLAQRLIRKGLVERRDDGLRLTSPGRHEAESIVRKHRLWELYLTRRLDLPADHVHRDAEAMEHALTDAAVDRFDELLGYPSVDPHGQPIPRRRVAAGAEAKEGT